MENENIGEFAAAAAADGAGDVHRLPVLNAPELLEEEAVDQLIVAGLEVVGWVALVVTPLMTGLGWRCRACG